MSTREAAEYLAGVRSSRELWNLVGFALRFRRHPAVRPWWRSMVRTYLTALMLQNLHIVEFVEPAPRARRRVIRRA